MSEGTIMEPEGQSLDPFEDTSGGLGGSYPQPVDEDVDNGHGDEAPPAVVEQRMIRVLATGSPNWTLSTAVQETMLHTWLNLDRSPILWVTRGNPQGADRMVEFCATKQSMPWTQFAPRPEDGERAERIANRELLISGVDYAILFVRNEVDTGLRHLRSILNAGQVPTQVIQVTDPGYRSESERRAAHRAEV